MTAEEASATRLRPVDARRRLSAPMVGAIVAAATLTFGTVFGLAVRSGESPAPLEAPSTDDAVVADSVLPVGTEQFTLPAPAGSQIRSVVVWSPDGTHVATALNGTATIWNAVTGEPLAEQHIDHLAAVSMLVWDRDGTRIAVGATVPDGNAIYDPLTSSSPLLSGVADRILDFSPGGARVVVGGAWGAAAILDASTGLYDVTLPLCPGPYSWVWDAAWSPDGTRIATTCDRDVRIWDAATGEELLTLRAGTRVTDVEWSPDGARIATASEDGDPKIWNADTGEELTSLTGHAAEVAAIAWSPDGTRIATASLDSTAKIWSAE